jgi:hypothetical protein
LLDFSGAQGELGMNTPSKHSSGKQVVRAALYARISTLNHGQDPEVQLRELRDYCQRRGFAITHEYVDKGIRALRSQENKGKLRKLLDRSRQARVVIEGEFYGPPLPAPKLPEAIKNQYHPGWGHLAAFPTKIVVYRIDSVSTTGDDAR